MIDSLPGNLMEISGTRLEKKFKRLIDLCKCTTVNKKKFIGQTQYETNKMLYTADWYFIKS